MKGAWRFIAVGAVCALLAVPASAASGRTLVVFTVDVESNETLRLPDQVDAVCKDGSACGFMEIARLLRERRWSGTFFLNVFEHQQWGETTMRNIAVRLQSAGQDVALHTHPQWGYDPARLGMNQYSLDEQTTIVRDGVRLLQAWTGRPVVAHRTGAYAADEHTLIALERNGLLVDSSVFWKDPNSRLDGLGLPRNLPAPHGRLTEIPVTVYERVDRPRILGAALSPLTVVRKIDPNWFVNADEVKAAIDAAVGSDLPVLVVFLHSFSFLAGPTAGGPPLADRHAMDMFRVILDNVARKDLPVVTMRELAHRGLPPLLSPDRDVVPQVTVPVDLHRYAWHRVRASVGLSLTIGVGVTLLSAGAVLVLARRRKATWRMVPKPGAGGASPAPSGVASR
jgi:peptidoglycan/xylan/chitin deacetylase (PgdA/CDA1 family)